MADIVAYKADTQLELGRFHPGTPEADMWQEVVTPDVKGRLRDSSGDQVMRWNAAVGRGEYRFYADEAAGEHQSQARLHRHPCICSMVCLPQTANTGQV